MWKREGEREREGLCWMNEWCNASQARQNTMKCLFTILWCNAKSGDKQSSNNKKHVENAFLRITPGEGERKGETQTTQSWKDLAFCWILLWIRYVSVSHSSLSLSYAVVCKFRKSIRRVKWTHRKFVRTHPLPSPAPNRKRERERESSRQ